jgi:hypothetical protein
MTALWVSISASPKGPALSVNGFKLWFVPARCVLPLEKPVPASIWSGSISFGLVSIPVRLAVATEKKDIAFHMLHRKDGSRIKQRYFCAATLAAL